MIHARHYMLRYVTLRSSPGLLQYTRKAPPKRTPVGPAQCLKLRYHIGEQNSGTPTTSLWFLEHQRPYLLPRPSFTLEDSMRLVHFQFGIALRRVTTNNHGRGCVKALVSTPHAARRTPHAARRAPHAVMTACCECDVPVLSYAPVVTLWVGTGISTT